MGSSSWSDDTFRTLSATNSTKTRAQVFTNTSTDKDMNPKGVKFRESRDSDAHPFTIAISFNLDETGSMGEIPEILVKKKLGALMETLIAHGVPDAQLMFTGIGDHYSDRSPLQVGQFESGTEELNKWLSSIYLEHGGGGQDMESYSLAWYSLAWYFAARHTSIDCMEKRGQKGFLFTVGDELMGTTVSEDITAEQALREAQKNYHVFHLHIKQTSTGSNSSIIDRWKNLMGERLIIVEDYNNIAEIVATTVAVINGADINNVVSTFDSKTANAVTNALVKVTSDIVKTPKEGIVKL